LPLTGIVLALFGYLEARGDPVIRRLDVPVAGWPPGQAPVQLALLSAIHIGSPAMDAARLNRIVDQVNAANPDLVLIAGDFVFGHDPSQGARSAAQLTAPLRRLRARLGSVAVMGNHDHWTAPAAIAAALRAAGVRLLANEAEVFGPVEILAVDDAFSGHADAARALKAGAGKRGFPVLLSHSPDLLTQLPQGAAPLVLMGHTHCGQVVLPGIGAPARISPFTGQRLYDPRYRCGVVHDPGRTVVVTAGLGTSGVPLRIGAPPDWWLITLKPDPNRPYSRRS
jgi:predicted MPP superfamily phosphohydrolase